MYYCYLAIIATNYMWYLSEHFSHVLSDFFKYDQDDKKSLNYTIKIWTKTTITLDRQYIYLNLSLDGIVYVLNVYTKWVMHYLIINNYILLDTMLAPGVKTSILKSGISFLDDDESDVCVDS